MSGSISRLIYISSNRIRGDDASVRMAIDSILDSARIANAQADITGALMFNKGRFAQILEGRRVDIEETFERIQYDDRHSDVVILSFEKVVARSFSFWSMGYVGENQQMSEVFDSIRNTSGFVASDIPAERIFTLLRESLIEAESNAYETDRRTA
ncbi:MAG: BLUF domain-containing protein [Granulosicoccus sp.]